MSIIWKAFSETVEYNQFNNCSDVVPKAQNS